MINVKYFTHILFVLLTIILSNFTNAKEISDKNSLKVLIVTEELSGFKSDGDIGTYYDNLASFLKQKGHAIDILYIGEKDENDGQTKKKLYQNINFISLPAWAGPKIINQKNISLSFEIYRFIKDKDYDVIFYADCKGFGFYLTEAKRQGYAFEKTLLVGSMLRSTEWLWDTSNDIDCNIENYLTSHIEEISIKHSDILLIHSQFCSDMYKKNGWIYPKDVKLMPIPYMNKEIAENQELIEKPINEIVYVGRLDFRNGYDIFSKMVKAAYIKKPDLIKNLKITFIGEGSTDDFKSINPEFSNKIKHIKSMNQSRINSYLQVPGLLVIFASRSELLSYAQVNAIYNNVKFIGLENGLLENLIRKEDINSVLTYSLNPNKLAQKLCDVLDVKMKLRVKPRYNLSEVENYWNKFNDHIVNCVDKLKEVKKISKADSPLVSVCMAHYNRPDQLMEALKSLENQDYKNFEVLVMDDGSTLETREILKRDVEPYMKKKGWRLFYQENQYPDAARNNLAAQAKGDWLMFMDDDNIALSDEISRFIRIAQKTQAGIVLTNYFIANKIKTNVDQIKLTFGNALIPTTIAQNYLGDTNMLISKESFLKLGGWHVLYGLVCSDQKLLIDAVAKNIKTVVSVEPTFIYNQVGQLHIMNSIGNTANFQHKIVSQSYARMLPHELRHLPFLTYSLSQKPMLTLDTVSAKKIIVHRVKVKITEIAEYVILTLKSIVNTF